jgi:predicted alpha-1,6-mannanase (GH76 family)
MTRRTTPIALLCVLGASIFSACSSDKPPDGSDAAAGGSSGAAGSGGAESPANGGSDAGPSGNGGRAGAQATGGAGGPGDAGVADASADSGAKALPVVPLDEELRERAQAGMVPLAAWYHTDTGLWDKNDWWTSANHLETVIDYTRETGDPTYADEIDNTFEKNKGSAFDRFGFYDDDGWWALAWVKAYDLTRQQKYLDMAKTIFRRMSAGWDDKCGGGIYWASAKNGTDGLKNKNAIPNSLFLTLAARLHQRTPNDTGPGSFLDWAQREWTWFKGTGMLNADHQVIDGLDNLTACKAAGPIFTYNNGSLIGGLTELALATGDGSLLDEANAIARATITRMASSNGVLVEAPCGGDICVQFKGVFMRNLALLNQRAPAPEYRTYMRLQSDNLWNSNRNAKSEFAYAWHTPLDAAKETPTASRQSSALDALVAAVRSSSMNHAVGARASSSDASCSPTEGPINAIDGSSRMNGKWCATGGADRTLLLDLGADRSVVGFRVRHAGAGGEDSTWNTRDFEILTSTDGQAFAPAVVVTGNTADVTTHGIPPTTVRYVRLHVTNAQTATDLVATRIYELEVFGTTW